MVIPMVLYVPVTEYFYYGGGWPFVQILFVVMYLIGVRYIFKSDIPLTFKLALCFWWILWVLEQVVSAFLA